MSLNRTFAGVQVRHFTISSLILMVFFGLVATVGSSCSQDGRSHPRIEGTLTRWFRAEGWPADVRIEAIALPESAAYVPMRAGQATVDESRRLLQARVYQAEGEVKSRAAALKRVEPDKDDWFNQYLETAVSFEDWRRAQPSVREAEHSLQVAQRRLAILRDSLTAFDPNDHSGLAWPVGRVAVLSDTGGAFVIDLNGTRRVLLFARTIGLKDGFGHEHEWRAWVTPSEHGATPVSLTRFNHTGMLAAPFEVNLSPTPERGPSPASDLATGAGGLLFLVTMAAAGLALYFIPTTVAMRRRHHNQAAIFALNLFLGWTFVGWVIALVWALTRRPNSPVA